MKGRPSLLPHPNIDGAGVPSAIDGVPPCPPDVKGPARKVWDELVPMLHAMGLVTLLDGFRVKRYCILRAAWERANKKVGVHEVRKGGQRGGEYQTPWLFVRNKIEDQLGELEKSLGIDAKARRQMGVKPMKAGPKGPPIRDRSEGPPPPEEITG